MWEYMQFALFLSYFKYVVFLGFQSPLTFLTFHLLALRIFLQVRSFILPTNSGNRRRSFHNHNKSGQTIINEKDEFATPSQDFSLRPESRLVTVAVGVTSTMSVACLLLAIVQLRSLGFGYMLLPVSEAMILLSTSCGKMSSSGGILQLAITATAALLAAVLIIIGETSIDGTGVALLASAGSLWAAREVLKRDQPQTLERPENLVSMGLLLAGVLALKFENVYGFLEGQIDGVEKSTLMLHLLVNLLLCFGLIVPFSSENTEEEEEEEGLKASFPLRTAVEGVLLLAGGKLLPSYIAFSQIVGYALLRTFVFQMRMQLERSSNKIISSPTITPSAFTNTLTISVPKISSQDIESASPIVRKIKKNINSAAYLTLPVLIVIMLRIQFHLWLMASLAQPARIFPTDSGDIDIERPPPFEIVISAHDDESPQQILSLVEAVSTLDVFRGCVPLVTVYTDDAQLEDIPSAQGTDSNLVYNVVTGKSTSAQSAYLKHIITHWDTLATQMLFVSASIFPPYSEGRPSSLFSSSDAELARHALLYRLSTSFIPDRTGFLSLSAKNTDCRCNSCSDSTGWRFPEASELVKLVQPFAECDAYSRLPLTTGGSFVASKRRIKGINRGFYERFLGEGVSMEETVEKMWGVIMRCADERIGAMCPTVPHGWFAEMVDGGIRREDECQCLDY